MNPEINSEICETCQDEKSPFNLSVGYAGYIMCDPCRKEELEDMKAEAAWERMVGA